MAALCHPQLVVCLAAAAESVSLQPLGWPCPRLRPVEQPGACCVPSFGYMQYAFPHALDYHWGCCWCPATPLWPALERSRYTLAMLQFTHELDMQVPTLLLGDFNGSAHPHRHYLSGTSQSHPSSPS